MSIWMQSPLRRAAISILTGAHFHLRERPSVPFVLGDGWKLAGMPRLKASREFELSRAPSMIGYPPPAENGIAACRS